MLRFDWVRLTNFKSFAGTQTFEFPNRSGLYFVTGDNAVEPELEANGAGKSTLWDALHWALFGDTPAGLRAAAVRTWGATKTVSVVLGMDRDGTTLELTRSWGPVRCMLSVNGGEPEDVDAARLAAETGLTRAVFNNAVLISQFATTFFDLGPTDKLALFTDLLGLDQWLRRAERAGQRVRLCDDELANHDRTTANLEGRAEELERRIGELERLVADHDTNKAGRLRQQQAVVADAAEVVADKRAAKDRLQKALDAHKRTAPPAPDDARAQLKKAQAAFDDAQQKLAGLERELQLLKEALRDLDTLGDSCPVCRQPITAEHLGGERRRLEAKLAALNTKRSELSQLVGSSRVVQRAATDTLDLVADQLRTWQAHGRSLAADAERCDEDVATALRSQQRATDELERLRVEANPHAVPLEDAAAKLVWTTGELRRLGRERGKLEARRENYAYWVNGFKLVRLHLVEQALAELTASVNNNLAPLGLVGWQVRFDVERETKGGNVSRGFHAFAASPASAGEVPWNAWSGGELQRLRLAGAMGLADLITARTGITTSLEIWDEPSQHVGGQGVDDILDTLYDRARTADRQVWLVEHRALDYGAFAGVYRVTKDDRGSRIDRVAAGR